MPTSQSAEALKAVRERRAPVVGRWVSDAFLPKCISYPVMEAERRTSLYTDCCCPKPMTIPEWLDDTRGREGMAETRQDDAGPLGRRNLRRVATKHALADYPGYEMATAHRLIEDCWPSYWFQCGLRLWKQEW